MANHLLPDFARPNFAPNFAPNSDQDSDRNSPPPLPSAPNPDRERLKLILIGSAEEIREMIYRLQQCQIAEVGDWSRLLSAPETITPAASEAMSILVLHPRRNR